VVVKEDQEIPLWEYLPGPDEESIKKKIRYYEEKQQKLIQGEIQLDLVNEKRLAETTKWLEEKSKRQKRVQFRKEKAK